MNNMNETTSSRTITVLFISHSSAIGGAEKSLLDIIKFIDKKHFTPILYLPREGPLKVEFEQLGIKTYCGRLPKCTYSRDKATSNLFQSIKRVADILIFGVIASMRLCRIAKDENVDIIYTNTISTLAGATAAKLSNRPHVWHIREFLGKDTGSLTFPFSNKTLLRFVPRFSDAIITNSRAVGDQFKQEGMQSAPFIVHNGISTEEFKIAEFHNPLKNSLEGSFLIAIVGTLSVRKAQDDAIRAINLVKDVIPAIELHIIGQGDKKYETYLKRLVNDLGLNDNVVFEGQQNDIRTTLSKFNVLLITSIHEPFGRVAIEGMAAGLPIIASNTGGLNEIISDGFDGFLVPIKQPEIIADKILYLYYNYQVMIEMGRNGRATALTSFNVDQYIKRIEMLIDDLYSHWQ